METPATVLARYNRGFQETQLIPIPQQHTGNCASDTIQTIMFFADGFCDCFLNLVRGGRQMPVTGQEYINYINIATDRFTYIYARNDTLTSFGAPQFKLGRQLSTGNTLPTYMNMGCKGTQCSASIARYMKPTVTPTSSAAWSYDPRYYTPFTLSVLSAFADTCAYTPRIWPEVDPNPTSPFPPITDTLPPDPPPHIVALALPHLVAIQFCLFTGSAADGFHTFCFFRHTVNETSERASRNPSRWYIGDNMTGAAIPMGSWEPTSNLNFRISYTCATDPADPYTKIFSYTVHVTGQTPQVLTTPPIKISHPCYAGLWNESRSYRKLYFAIPTTSELATYTGWGNGGFGSPPGTAPMAAPMAAPITTTFPSGTFTTTPAPAMRPMFSATPSGTFSGRPMTNLFRNFKPTYHSSLRLGGRGGKVHKKSRKHIPKPRTNKKYRKYTLKKRHLR